MKKRNLRSEGSSVSASSANFDFTEPVELADQHKSLHLLQDSSDERLGSLLSPVGYKKRQMALTGAKRSKAHFEPLDTPETSQRLDTPEFITVH